MPEFPESKQELGISKPAKAGEIGGILGSMQAVTFPNITSYSFRGIFYLRQVELFSAPKSKPVKFDVARRISAQKWSD